MSTESIPFYYQLFFIVVPTISIIGNSLIVYVTICSNVEDHQLRNDICCYWQTIPTIGVSFTLELLFSVALDRLMSTRTFYISLTEDYFGPYTCTHILSALIFALFTEAWIITDCTSSEYVLCGTWTPITGAVREFLQNAMMVIIALTVVCYTLLLCSMKKLAMSRDNMKHIYRSLIVISLTMVIGWFGATLFAVAGSYLNIQFIQPGLLSALLVTFATTTNFFVYYGISVEDHQLRHDICCYWQTIPIIGVSVSFELLFSVALDRLMSTRTFYKSLTGDYFGPYTCTHVLSALIYALFTAAWIFTERTSSEYVLCGTWAPITGAVREFLKIAMMVIIALTVVCYTLLLCSMKKLEMSRDNMKHIYRSLIIISLTMVLGWFGATMYAVASSYLNIQLIHPGLLSTILVSLATTTNFFVYYGISTLYRRIFDSHLLIGRFKKEIGKRISKGIGTTTM